MIGMQIHIVLILNNDSHAIYLLLVRSRHMLAVYWIICLFTLKCVCRECIACYESFKKQFNQLYKFILKKNKNKTLYMLENLESG